MTINDKKIGIGAKALTAFSFALAWGLYLFYVMPLADQVTGPCEGTPGHDYKGAIIVLPLYFALFGYLLFYIVRDWKSTFIKIGIAVLILVALPLMFSLALFSFFLNDAVITFIREHNGFNAFYKYGCYGDIDVQDIWLTMITALLLGLSIFCIRYSK